MERETKSPPKRSDVDSSTGQMITATLASGANAPTHSTKDSATSVANPRINECMKKAAGETRRPTSA